MAWEQGQGQLEPDEPATERQLARCRFPDHWQGASGLSTSLLLIPFGEERQTGRVAVEKVSMADRADFALRKEPCKWDGP